MSLRQASEGKPRRASPGGWVTNTAELQSVLTLYDNPRIPWTDDTIMGVWFSINRYNTGNKLSYYILFVTDQDQVNIFLVLSFFQIDGDFVMYGEFTEGTVIKRIST